MATETGTKRTRAARRNFQHELEVLKLHIEISIEILEEMNAKQPSEHQAGQLAALRTMLSRMEAKNGK